MRLIDADSLQRRICGANCGCEYEDCGNEGDCGYDHFISNAHIIDAVPVVRCWECTEFDETEHECSHWYGFRENDFCSYGKRKEGADNG